MTDYNAVSPAPTPAPNVKTPAAAPAKTYSSVPAKDDATAERTAAKGNDDVMSQPAQPAKKS